MCSRRAFSFSTSPVTAVSEYPLAKMIGDLGNSSARGGATSAIMPSHGEVDNHDGGPNAVQFGQSGRTVVFHDGFISQRLQGFGKEAPHVRIVVDDKNWRRQKPLRPKAPRSLD